MFKSTCDTTELSLSAPFALWFQCRLQMALSPARRWSSLKSSIASLKPSATKALSIVGQPRCSPLSASWMARNRRLAVAMAVDFDLCLLSGMVNKSIGFQNS